jgi:ABC-type multidrug transport system fused ATPase/permease subunit
MSLISRSLRYFLHERIRIALLSLAVCVGTVAALLQIWPTIVLLDAVIGQRSELSWIHRLFLMPLPTNQTGQIAGLAMITLLLRIVQECSSRARGLLNLRISYSGLLRVRCDLFRSLQGQSISFHQSRPQGDAIYRLISDTSGLQTILNVLIELASASLMLAIMVCILASRNLVLTMLALSVSPFLLATNILFGRVLSRRTQTAKEAESALTTTAQRSIAAVRLVQAYGQQGPELQRFHRSAHTSIHAWLRLHWQEVFYGLSVSVIFGIGGAVVFGYGGYLVWEQMHDGVAGMSIGDLMLFMTYLGMLYDPLCKISGAGASLQSGLTSATRVFEVIDAAPTICNQEGAIALPPLQRTLALREVSFHYEGGRKVLEDVSVTIRPGEMVAFVGSSGGGKTTLLNLIPRFHDPTAGEVLLDGRDLRHARIDDVRKHVALVLQESVILPTTIAENIAYGRPDALPNQIQLAAQLAGADEFIRQMPQGYDSPVSEGGQNLSGGQRQRIAIARALLTEAPIIVLDEPTSALDPMHEQLLMDQLERLKGHRTIMIVTHRVQSLGACDQIFVLDRGKISECGTHEDLLRRGGQYAAMLRPAGIQQQPANAETPDELVAA